MNDLFVLVAATSSSRSDQSVKSKKYGVFIFTNNVAAFKGRVGLNKI